MSTEASCRILVVSPTAARAHQFVERVQALSASRHGAAGQAGEDKSKDEGKEKDKAISGSESEVQTSVSTHSDPLAAGSSTSIPWTIVNKYYTADVHFETHEFEHFRVHHAIGVPAIIYVWGPGEPYREHIPEIADKVQHYDPEVSLAVRFGESATVLSPPTIDDDGLDEFLSSHGFEFVEGDRSYRRPTQDTDRHSDDEDSGIPGLPRVIDALSTIMWPSIVQSEATRQRKSRARDLIGWALEEEGDDGLRALIADPSASSSSEPPASATSAAAKRKSRMQREMEELERWLEDEETGSGVKFARGDEGGRSLAPSNETLALAVPPTETSESDIDAQIWVGSAPVSSADGWEDMLTPPAIRTPRADPDSDHERHSDPFSEHGFEDDFADFVSATSQSTSHLDPHAHARGFGFGPSEDRLLEVNYDVGRLTPMHTGMSYRSLGSVSDFGGGDDSLFVSRDVPESAEYGALDDGEEDDPDLPSRAEILETSRRIFGAAAFAPAPDTSPSTVVASPTQLPQETSSAPTERETPPPSVSTDPANLSLDSEDGDGDESFAAFDLSRVFSVLQGMKDKIAGMENEDERRHAAARVALGLVYGLGVGGDRPDQSVQASTATPSAP